MKVFLFLMAVFMASSGVATSVQAGCDHANDRASDGSRCGGRAADQKAGGK